MPPRGGEAFLPAELGVASDMLHARRRRPPGHAARLRAALLETYRTVADFTYDWEVWIGPDGRLRYVSPSCARVSGFDPAEVVADAEFFARAIHPQDLPAWRAAMAAQARADRSMAARGEQDPELPSCPDFRLRRKDGREIWLAQETTRVFDASGRFRGLRLSLREVTDRVQAQMALAKAREELEHRVRERTRELDRAKRELRQEIRRGRKVQKELETSRERFCALSNYLQERIEAERARISREIHDELGQNLTALNMGLFSLEQAARNGHSPDPDRLASLKALTAEAITTVQRISRELRPAILDELGLGDALAWLVRSFEQSAATPASLERPADPLDLDPETATALYRVCQEALTNVARHAGASRVWVRLGLSRGRLTLTVQDDGCGVRPEALDDPHNLGLVGMRERMRAVGGDLSVGLRPGGGAAVTVTVRRKRSGAGRAAKGGHAANPGTGRKRAAS
ncbi:hypothetical protein JCM15519_20370 [Fundidesulfovibrio butyratiphilus]